MKIEVWMMEGQRALKVNQARKFTEAAVFGVG